MPVALVTGASRGLGLALAQALDRRGWDLVVDARNPADLDAAVATLTGPGRVTAIAGDVADPEHRRSLAGAIADLGRLDALVNNASLLGPSPQPPLARYPLDVLEDVYRVNVFAPLALTQLVLPWLDAAGGRILNITSDAAVEPYEGWGGYGSSKAALEQLGRIWAAELAGTGVRLFTVDPGEMNTRMHAEATPEADPADSAALADPAAVAARIVALIDIADEARAPAGARVRVS